MLELFWVSLLFAAPATMGAAVFANTSAEAAGLRTGDLIVAIDGIPVNERGCQDPRGAPVGRRMVLSHIRDGIQADAEIETEALIP